MVRCCRTYEEVCEGDVGKVIKLDRDGLHDLNVQSDWQHKGGTYWVRYIHVELLGEQPVPRPAPAWQRPPSIPPPATPVLTPPLPHISRLPSPELPRPHQDRRQGAGQSRSDHPEVQVGLRDPPERGCRER